MGSQYPENSPWIVPATTQCEHWYMSVQVVFLVLRVTGGNADALSFNSIGLLFFFLSFLNRPDTNVEK